MRSIRTRFSVAFAGILLVASALAGCANTSPDLEESAAGSLQAAVLEVTNAAKAGDYLSAQSLLESLQAELLAAAAADQVSASRTAQIQAAINTVSAELSVQIKAIQDEAARLAAEQAAADAETARLAAEQAAENDTPAPPAEDPGKDDDKGKGEGGKGEGEGGKDKGDDCKKGKDDC
jgi:hypothetical protein